MINPNFFNLRLLCWLGWWLRKNWLWSFESDRGTGSTRELETCAIDSERLQFGIHFAYWCSRERCLILRAGNCFDVVIWHLHECLIHIWTGVVWLYLEQSFSLNLGVRELAHSWACLADHLEVRDGQCWSPSCHLGVRSCSLLKHFWKLVMGHVWGISLLLHSDQATV